MIDGTNSFEERILKTTGRLRTFRDSLEAVPHWIPAEGLLRRIDEVRRRIEELKEEPERKLAVVIVGPTGAGKSTLINALAGCDEMSTTGNQRPTTRVLTVFCADPEDGRYFCDKAGSDNVRITSSRLANNLKNLVIVDTPDTNSAEAAEHAPLVAAAIRAADVLLCAFPAENAVRRDQIAYLGNWVQQFNRDALYAIVSMSEKLSAEDMQKNVVEQLNEKLRENWGRTPHKIFAVSARSHLENPKWDGAERPHPECRDEFPQLRSELSENFNRAGAQTDMRAARAEQWVAELGAMIGRSAKECAPAARKALDGIRDLENSVWMEAVKESNQGVAASGLEYAIASRMWGPVSWFLMLWAFIMQIVAVLTAMVEALRRVTFRKALGGFGTSGSMKEQPVLGDKDIARIAGTVSTNKWPDIKPAVRRAGFMEEYQKNPLSPPPQGEDFCIALAEAMRHQRDSLVRKLADDTFRGFGASLLLNIIFLLPALAFLYFVLRAYLTAGIIQAGISADAGWLLAMWWLLILSLIHGWVRWRENRLGGKARQDIMQTRKSPVALSYGLTGEFSRIIELEGEQ